MEDTNIYSRILHFIQSHIRKDSDLKCFYGEMIYERQKYSNELIKNRYVNARSVQDILNYLKDVDK